MAFITIEGGFIPRTKFNLDWQLSADAFQRFLDWLDAGAGTPGERYLEMRRRLVSYFDRKGCRDADTLTDETLNRVARRLEEEGAIQASSPAQYCYVVARFVFFEYLRRGEHTSVSFDDATEKGATLPGIQSPDPTDAELDDSQQRFRCLEQCLATLTPPDRDLILAYYSGERSAKIERRKQLALLSNISANALTIKACRIRARIEDCVSGCVGKE
jgi:DNA-directed RNA polymerase specialized sigma24 family protein